MDTELEIEISPGSPLSLKVEPQVWTGENADIMQTSMFAGQQIMAIQKSDDEPDVFELHYLGLMVSGFNSMDEAKDNAPAFVREVLNQLSKLIKD